MTNPQPLDCIMTTNEFRADLREIRANVQKVEEDLTEVKVSLTALGVNYSHLTKHLEKAQKTMEAIQKDLSKKPDQTWLSSTLAQLSAPKTIGAILALIGAISMALGGGSVIVHREATQDHDTDQP